MCYYCDILSVCGKIPHCNHRRCKDNNEDLRCMWCDGEIKDSKYWTAYAGHLDDRLSCQSEYFVSLSIKTKINCHLSNKMKKISRCRYTNEKGKCEKRRVFFCNYRSYPCQHFNHCPRKSTAALETKKKRKKPHIYP